MVHLVGHYDIVWDCLYVTLSLPFRGVFSNHTVSRVCTIIGLCVSMSMEHVLYDTDRGQPKYSERNLSPYPLVHHKPCTDCLDIKPSPPR
jgi:hypothetical protein